MYYSNETIKKISVSCRVAYNDCLKDIDNIHLYVSSGNTKIGATVNISGLPLIQCTNCKNCIRSCYAFKIIIKYGYSHLKNPTMRKWTNNTVLLKNDPVRYFKELQFYFDIHKPFFCRLHVSGDIISLEHLDRLIKFMKNNKYCTFQSFTKSYKIINEWIDLNGLKQWPKNFKLLFSGWPNFDITPFNKYNFPVFSPIDKNGVHGIPSGYKIVLCPGKCEVCELAKKGCYAAKQNTGVIVKLH